MTENRRPPSKQSRLAILEANDLLHAPASVQKAFWLGYNSRQKRRGRLPATLGELTTRCLAERVTPASKGLTAAATAWDKVVPATFRFRTRVNRLRGGCLEIAVDSKSTEFVLRRRRNLLDDLRAQLRGFRLAKLTFVLEDARRESDLDITE